MNKTITDYKIITSRNIDDVEQKVNVLLAEKYHLYGSPTTSSFFDAEEETGHTRFTQVMVQYENEDGEIVEYI